MSYKEIKGDLINLARGGMFDVIVHGCNCFCTQKSGIAASMAKTFGTDKFPMEKLSSASDIRKLGNIDYKSFKVSQMSIHDADHTGIETQELKYHLTVVNAYTQYYYSRTKKPLDYEALTLCMRKINKIFKGENIGLPQIGSGLAGGDWNRIKKIIQKELIDCNVTVVIYNK